MATIRTAIQIYDGMTGPLQSMHRAMNILINGFETMQRTSGNAIDTSAIQEAREELARAGAVFDEIEQNISRADDQQRRFNRSVRDGSSAADTLWNKLKGIAITVGGLSAIKNVVGISDTLTSTNARLNLLVDDGGSLAELERNVMASAQRSRAAYFDTASAVAKLGLNAGNAFDHDINQVIAFMEQVNKQFVIGGANAVEQSAAMIQLTQAMGAGALRGEELNSILDAAPGIARAIEQYMGVAEGSIKQYAEQGLVTAEVVKNALFSIADETNAKFESMPMTWAQIWNSMQNKALSVFTPILNRINEIGNSQRFQQVSNGIIDSLAAIATIATFVFDLLISGGAFVVDNWSWLAPIIYGVAGALMVYYGAQLAVNGITVISHGIHVAMAAAEMIRLAVTGALTAATAAQTAAQYGLNAAMYACPIVWIMILIIAIIALFYAAVAAINKFAGTSISATGVICGALMVAAAFIGNLFVAVINFIIDIFVVLWNFIASFANFFANVFNDPVGAVARLFFDLVDTVLSLLQSLASAIDTIFGSNLSGAVQGWRDSLGGWVDSTFGKGVEVMAKLSSKDMHLGRFEYGAAWDAGYNFGQGIEDKVSGLFDFSTKDILGADDAFALGNTLDGIYNNTGDIADNTRNTSDAIEFNNEELELLRNIAEREAINKYTTAEIKVEMHNNNNISSEMYLDGVINLLEIKLVEAMAVSAEGGHI